MDPRGRAGGRRADRSSPVPALALPGRSGSGLSAFAYSLRRGRQSRNRTGRQTVRSRNGSRRRSRRRPSCCPTPTAALGCWRSRRDARTRRTLAAPDGAAACRRSRPAAARRARSTARRSAPRSAAPTHRAPARVAEEAMRARVMPHPRQPRADEHPRHRPQPGLRRSGRPATLGTSETSVARSTAQQGQQPVQRSGNIQEHRRRPPVGAAGPGSHPPAASIMDAHGFGEAADAPLSRPAPGPLRAVKPSTPRSRQLAGATDLTPPESAKVESVSQPGEGSAEVLRGLGCGIGALAQLCGSRRLQVSDVAA